MVRRKENQVITEMSSSVYKGGPPPPFSVPACIHAVELFDSLTSTNDYLLSLASRINSNHPYHQRNIVCIAEQQTAGKGREGRQWISPKNNIYLSLLWHFPFPVDRLSGLSLAIGCAVVNTVRILIKESPHAQSIASLGLKWPNDVLWNHQKLSGILIEIAPLPDSSLTQNAQAIIGIGLNLKQPSTALITQPWTDLNIILGSMPDKNQVISILLEELVNVLTQFQIQGFSAFMPEWHAWDLSLGKKVNIITPAMNFHGTGQGVNSAGLFLLKTNSGEIRTFASGEISLRLAVGEIIGNAYTV